MATDINGKPCLQFRGKGKTLSDVLDTDCYIDIDSLYQYQYPCQSLEESLSVLRQLPKDKDRREYHADIPLSIWHIPVALLMAIMAVMIVSRIIN